MDTNHVVRREGESQASHQAQLEDRTYLVAEEQCLDRERSR
jgi:hypothetical protein